MNFDKLPAWQKRGAGIWWENVPKEGYNPVSKQTVTTLRRELHTEYDLPLREEYAEMIGRFLK